MKTIVKLLKGYENFLSYFELGGRGTKTFQKIILRYQNFLLDAPGAQKPF